MLQRPPILNSAATRHPSGVLRRYHPAVSSHQIMVSPLYRIISTARRLGTQERIVRTMIAEYFTVSSGPPLTWST